MFSSTFSDPIAYLKSANSILKNDGILFIAVPNYYYLKLFKTGVLSKILFNKATNLHSAEHLFNYTPKSISLMLEYAGFKIDFIGQSTPLNYGSPLFRIVKNIGRPIAKFMALFNILIGGIHVIAKKKITMEVLLICRIQNEFLILFFLQSYYFY